MEELADNVNSAARKAGMTQTQIASLTGVNRRTVNEIFTGKGNPTLETIAKIESVLGQSIL